jgi:hypothetical protein
MKWNENPFSLAIGPRVTKMRVDKVAEIEGVSADKATRYLIQVGWDRWMAARCANALPPGHHLAKGITKGERP